MQTKNVRIEALAKKFGSKKGFGCKPEESCTNCPLAENCPCLEFAEMALDLGYGDKKEIQHCTATTILSIIKVHAYYPILSTNIRVIDEDDLEKEVQKYINQI